MMLNIMRPSIKNSVKGSDSRPQGVQLRLENARNKQCLPNSRPLSRDRHILKVLVMALGVQMTLAASEVQGTSNVGRKKNSNTRTGYTDSELMAFKADSEQCFLHMTQRLVRELNPKFIEYCTLGYFEKMRQKILEEMYGQLDYEIFDKKNYSDVVIFQVLRSFGIDIEGIPNNPEYMEEIERMNPDLHEQLKFKINGYPTQIIGKLDTRTKEMESQFKKDYTSYDPKYPAYIFYGEQHWYCMICTKGVWSLYDSKYNGKTEDFRYGKVLDKWDARNFFHEEIKPIRTKRLYESRNGFQRAETIFRVPKIREDRDQDVLIADCQALLETRFEVAESLQHKYESSRMQSFQGQAT